MTVWMPKTDERGFALITTFLFMSIINHALELCMYIGRNIIHCHN